MITPELAPAPTGEAGGWRMFDLPEVESSGAAYGRPCRRRRGHGGHDLR
jgi:hypothetical protein